MILGISGLAGSGKDTFAQLLAKQHGFEVLSLADPIKRICRDVFGFTDEQLWGPSAERSRPDTRYKRPCLPCQKTGLLMDGGTFDEDLNEIVGGHTAPCPDCAGKGYTYLTAREALQTIGTDIGRSLYRDVWVEYAIRQARKLENNPHLHSAPDSLSGCKVYDGRYYDLTREVMVCIPDVRFRNEIDGLRAAGAKVVRIRRLGAGLKGAAGAHPSESEQGRIPDDVFDYVVENNGTLEELAGKADQLMKCLQVRT